MRNRVPGADIVVCEHQIVPQDCPYCELKRLRASLKEAAEHLGDLTSPLDVRVEDAYRVIVGVIMPSPCAHCGAAGRHAPGCVGELVRYLDATGDK